MYDVHSMDVSDLSKRNFINCVGIKTKGEDMKSVMVVLMVTILATSSWAGKIVYDFENEGQFADWRAFPPRFGENYEDQWFVENGELVAIGRERCGWSKTYRVGDDTWKDYVFEFQFRIKQTFMPPDPCGAQSGTAVVAGAFVHLPPGETNPGAPWCIWFGPHNQTRTGGTWMLIYGVGGDYKGPFPMDPPVEEHIWYTGRIEGKDAHYRMFLDGKLIVELDAGLPEDNYGGIYLAMRNGEVHFDNVVVEGDGIPNTSVTAVSHNSRLATMWGNIKSSR